MPRPPGPTSSRSSRGPTEVLPTRPAPIRPPGKVLLRRAAEVWDRDLGLPEQAVEAWRALVAQIPQDAGARAALDACLVRSGRLSEVADELRRRIAAPPGRAARADRPARALPRAGGRRRRGGAGLARGAGRGRRDPAALRGLADALAALSALGPAEVEERAAVLGRLAERPRRGGARGSGARPSAPPRRPARAARRGGPAAVRSHGERAPRRRARRRRWLALEALLARGVEATAVAQVLARIYTPRGRAGSRPPRSSSSPGACPPARPRRGRPSSSRRPSCGRLRLGDARGALSAAAAALRADPTNAGARAACERLAPRDGRRAGALRAPRRGGGAARGAARRRSSRSGRCAVHLAEEELGDLEGATHSCAAPWRWRRTRRLRSRRCAGGARRRALGRGGRAPARAGAARRRRGAERAARRAGGAPPSRAAAIPPARPARCGRRSRSRRRERSRRSGSGLAAAAGAESGDAAARRSEALAAAAEAQGDPRRLLAALQELAAPGGDARRARAAERRPGRGVGAPPRPVVARLRGAGAGERGPRPATWRCAASCARAAARAGADADAVRAYQALLPALPAAEAAPAWRELAVLFEERLADGERAVAAWAEALRLAPDEPGTLRALARPTGRPGASASGPRPASPWPRTHRARPRGSRPGARRRRRSTPSTTRRARRPGPRWSGSPRTTLPRRRRWSGSWRASIPRRAGGAAGAPPRPPRATRGTSTSPSGWPGCDAVWARRRPRWRSCARCSAQIPATCRRAGRWWSSPPRRARWGWKPSTSPIRS